jgi:hypothetical protein
VICNRFGTEISRSTDKVQDNPHQVC